jgi:hypothetical protein
LLWPALSGPELNVDRGGRGDPSAADDDEVVAVAHDGRSWSAMAPSPLPPKRATILMHEGRVLHISDLSRAMLG